MTTAQVLSLLTLCSAASHIYFEYRHIRSLVYVFKPLTMMLILAIAAFVATPVSDFYKAMVLLALCFSLLGDIFLMLPSDRFIAGLASFLVAHLFYLLAFWRTAVHAPSALVALAIVLATLPLYALLHPHLGNSRLPVGVYICVIDAMVWAALSRWLVSDTGSAVLAGWGAVLFMVSDSVLAFNRFRRPFRAARPIIMATYSAAQWLLAASISGVAVPRT